MIIHNHQKNRSFENTIRHAVVSLAMFLSLFLLLQRQAQGGDLLLTPLSGTFHYHRDFFGKVTPVVFPALEVPISWTWAKNLSLNALKSQPVSIEIPFITTDDGDTGIFPPAVSNWELY